MLSQKYAAFVGDMPPHDPLKMSKESYNIRKRAFGTYIRDKYVFGKPSYTKTDDIDVAMWFITKCGYVIGYSKDRDKKHPDEMKPGWWFNQNRWNILGIDDITIATNARMVEILNTALPGPFSTADFEEEMDTSLQVNVKTQLGDSFADWSAGKIDDHVLAKRKRYIFTKARKEKKRKYESLSELNRQYQTDLANLTTTQIKLAKLFQS